MIEALYSVYLECKVVNTDTRSIEQGSMFFALKGANFDGNKFADQAIQSGARYAVIDNSDYHIEGKTILVDDVLNALQELAKYHRKQLNIPVIAVTGSNGKTTTKELLNAVLSKKYNVAFTKGNLNNHIGVPLTLLSIDSKHEMALIEMGDNHPKEVEFLCEIASPDYGFVTNVGKDHLEGFGSFERNIEAKKEVFDYLNQNAGTIFLDLSDELVVSMVEQEERVITYGVSQAYSSVDFLGSDPLLRFKDELGQEIETNLFGAFNFNNIKLAYCIGKYFEVKLENISEALKDYQPDNNRSQVLKTDKNTLIMDAYNANPSSVEQAVNSFSEMQTQQAKWVILGDMYELGSFSEEEHENMSKLVAEKSFEEALLVGENYAKTRVNSDVKKFENKEDAEVYIKKIAPEGAIILLKGSRGMRLETFKEVL
ncbi:UDP-N-acetylmuramoyl-tripeptide--D-alanyl-D-alanine ligase [bacterium SCSIO 12643]|nr:UDP-N-acetylmuramoyl-tripeptide--D-alanyl-D-alanine ligase [bacterium SCSIO 12643]